MLISFPVGRANATLWDPKSKQMHSPSCRPTCFLCKILLGVATNALRLYSAHRNSVYRGSKPC
jgi:hypothetical protein